MWISILIVGDERGEQLCVVRMMVVIRLQNYGVVLGFRWKTYGFMVNDPKSTLTWKKSSCSHCVDK